MTSFSVSWGYHSLRPSMTLVHFNVFHPIFSLMMNGRNNGKKLLAVRIVAHAFEIIHLLTDQNPIQVVVDAIVNTGPREDSTRIGSQGTVRRQAVDVSPLRRVNQSIALLTIGVSPSLYVRFLSLHSFFYPRRPVNPPSATSSRSPNAS